MDTIPNEYKINCCVSIQCRLLEWLISIDFGFLLFEFELTTILLKNINLIFALGLNRKINRHNLGILLIIINNDTFVFPSEFGLFVLFDLVL